FPPPPLFRSRDPVVGPWAADRLRERDAAAYLSPWHASGELPDALDDLRQTGGRERMAPRLEAAGRIDRQASFERGLAVERRRPRPSPPEEPDVPQRDQRARRERRVEP